MIAALLLSLQAILPPGERPAAATVVVEPVGMMLAGFDRDGDARTSRAEAEAGIARSFTEVAKGQPTIGYIAYADWAERWLGDRAALPGPFEVDRDNDNRISLAELQDRIAAIFTRIDRNGDGALTRAELLTIRSMPGDMRRGRR